MRRPEEDAREFIETARIHAREIFAAAVEGADAGRIIGKSVRIIGHTLRVGPETLSLDSFSRIHLFGIGKAAAPSASALEAILGDRITGGLVVVPYGHDLPLRRVRVIQAGHPLPDESGVRATHRILEQIRNGREDDLILFLVSGGGSALFVQPDRGLTLADKIETTRALLRCGATIEEINAIRKRLSGVKGGKLIPIAFPATLVGILLSDVVGDRPESIASGPSVPKSEPAVRTREIIGRYRLENRLPMEVVRRLQAEDAPGWSDTSPEHRGRVRNVVVGSNRDLLQGARSRAETLGYSVRIVTDRLVGEARLVGRNMASLVGSILSRESARGRPLCLLAGGETTVTVRGEGKGGRCQEFTLSAALVIDGTPIVCLAAGSDGTDGPTDAAGAIADGRTVGRARKMALDPVEHLDRNDAFPLFDRLHDLIRTGPTRTNVLDLYLFLLPPQNTGTESRIAGLRNRRTIDPIHASDRDGSGGKKNPRRFHVGDSDESIRSGSKTPDQVRKGLSFRLREMCRRRWSALSLICRTRSRVIPMIFPISSSVRGGCSPRPK
jgi:hydroxypyruvate reductase